MDKKNLIGKKAAIGVALILVITSLGFVISQNLSGTNISDNLTNSQVNGSTNQDSSSKTSEVSNSVDCPDKVLNHCRSLSQEYNGSVKYQYNAQYTGMNGSAYYVQLESDSPVADTGKSTVIIKFDGESGRVWSVG
jgi:hypothetical protein